MKRSTVIALATVLSLSLLATVIFVLWQTEAEEVEEIIERAEAGEAAAQQELGQLYWHGKERAGLEPNLELAEQWLQRAAEQGNQPAQNALGRFYLAGGDNVGAYAWLSIAASPTNGNTAQLCDAIEDKLSQAQLTEARKLIEEVRGKLK